MTTVRELKRVLKEIEEKWTDEDRKYLGEFDDQYLYCDAFEPHARTRKYEGIDKVYNVHYDAQFGLMFFSKT